MSEFILAASGAVSLGARRQPDYLSEAAAQDSDDWQKPTRMILDSRVAQALGISDAVLDELRSYGFNTLLYPAKIEEEYLKAQSLLHSGDFDFEVHGFENLEPRLFQLIYCLPELYMSGKQDTEELGSILLQVLDLNNLWDGVSQEYDDHLILAVCAILKTKSKIDDFFRSEELDLSAANALKEICDKLLLKLCQKANQSPYLDNGFVSLQEAFYSVVSSLPYAGEFASLHQDDLLAGEPRLADSSLATMSVADADAYMAGTAQEPVETPFLKELELKHKQSLVHAEVVQAKEANPQLWDSPLEKIASLVPVEQERIFLDFQFSKLFVKRDPVTKTTAIADLIENLGNGLDNCFVEADNFLFAVRRIQSYMKRSLDELMRDFMEFMQQDAIDDFARYIQLVNGDDASYSMAKASCVFISALKKLKNKKINVELVGHSLQSEKLIDKRNLFIGGRQVIRPSDFVIAFDSSSANADEKMVNNSVKLKTPPGAAATVRALIQKTAQDTKNYGDHNDMVAIESAEAVKVAAKQGLDGLYDEGLYKPDIYLVNVSRSKDGGGGRKVRTRTPADSGSFVG